MSNYYVTRREDGWNVKKENAQRISGHFDTQKKAEKAAKEYSSNTGGGEVKIQGLDRRFRDSDTVPPGNDLNPPMDKKH